MRRPGAAGLVGCMAIHVLSFRVGWIGRGRVSWGRQTGPVPFSGVDKPRGSQDGARGVGARDSGSLCAPGLTLKCQEALGSNELPQASQVILAAARVEAAARMVRPHGQVAAMKPLLRRCVGRVMVSL